MHTKSNSYMTVSRTCTYKYYREKYYRHQFDTVITVIAEEFFKINLNVTTQTCGINVHMQTCERTHEHTYLSH